MPKSAASVATVEGATQDPSACFMPKVTMGPCVEEYSGARFPSACESDCVWLPERTQRGSPDAWQSDRRRDAR